MSMVRHHRLACQDPPRLGIGAGRDNRQGEEIYSRNMSLVCGFIQFCIIIESGVLSRFQPAGLFVFYGGGCVNKLYDSEWFRWCCTLYQWTSGPNGADWRTSL